MELTEIIIINYDLFVEHISTYKQKTFMPFHLESVPPSEYWCYKVDGKCPTLIQNY